MYEISVSSTRKEEIIEVTGKVQSIISESKIKEGICTIQILHTSAAIFVNENWDTDIGTDILRSLSNIVPKNAGYLHDRVDGNADAHIKSTIIGPSVTLIVSDGKLVMGEWQGVMFAEFDGPRDRKILVELVEKQQ